MAGRVAGRGPRRLAGCLALIVLAVPASIVLNLALTPAWSWFEASTGVESLGHSGPGEWTYVVVFGVLVGAGGLWMWRRGRRTPGS